MIGDSKHKVQNFFVKKGNFITKGELKKELLKDKFEKLDKDWKLDSFLQHRRKMNAYKSEKELDRIQNIRQKKIKLNWNLYMFF